jgi:hypothetical protein
MVSADLDRFYEILERLRADPAQGLRLRDHERATKWPARGVYFFFEDGELRMDGGAPRVVRVGTHAVSANAKSTLWSRLRAHRGPRHGGGNHRGSIFRQHVGNALLRRDSASHPTWGNRSAIAATRSGEAALERAVSAQIGAMSILWIDVPDEPSATCERAVIEQNAIALLSNSLKPLDCPSPGWLGLHSREEPIRRSGLWNVNYVAQSYDNEFLGALDAAVERTLHTVPQG